MAILRRDMRKRALMGGGGARSAAKRRAPNRSGAAAQQNCRWSKPVEQAFDSVRRGARGADEVGVEIARAGAVRSEEHTSELQSLMRISYAVFCLKKKKNINKTKCR